MVTFNIPLQCIECEGCGQQTPVSRQTQNDPHRMTETLRLAREVHSECTGNTAYESTLQRRWRGITLAQKHCGDRLVYSV